MLSQLIQLVEQHASDVIINNPAIPNQQNGAAIQDVSHHIFNELQRQASSGSLTQIVSLFQNGGGGALNSNPIVANMISSVAGSFASKYGVSTSNAHNMASTLLPNVLSQLISKTNNQHDNSFDLSSILQSVNGNNPVNVGNLVNQMLSNNNSGTTDSLLGFAKKFFN